MLLIASRHTSNGQSTASSVYYIQFYYDGDYAPYVQVLGSGNFVTFGVTGSAGSKTLTVQNTSGGQMNIAWFFNK